MLKDFFLGSTDFTAAIFKIPQISKHFSAVLKLSAKEKKLRQYGHLTSAIPRPDTRNCS